MTEQTGGKSAHHNTAHALWTALVGREEAVCCRCDGDIYSRGAFRQAIADRRRSFADRGVGEASRVIVVSGRGSLFWIDMLATWSLGGIVVPLGPDLSERHAAEILRSGKPEFCVGSFSATLPSFSELQKLPETYSQNWAGAEVGLEIEAVNTSDLAALCYTSGTTGVPKGVRVRHEMISGNMFATQSRILLRPTDRLFIAIPFRFISSISHFLVSILAGAAFHGTEATQMPRDLLATLEDLDITAFGGAPVQVRSVSQVAANRLPALRWVMSSGDHLSPDVIESLRETRPEIAINTVYGLTEVAGRLCTLAASLIGEAPGAVGTPIPGMEIQVRRDDGSVCSVGETGHVYARGRYCFDGYVGNDAATEKALGPHGFRTGDLGYLDRNGQLSLAGRSDSVFKRSGIKVSCLPIADALMETSLFKDATVMPRDDDLSGAVPVAYVVLKDGVEFNRGSIMKTLRSMLPANHLPADFVQVEQIPRTGSGKVLRGELLELSS